jgi:hypothetical protein
MIRPLRAALACLHRRLLGGRLSRWRWRRLFTRTGRERVWLVWRARTARGVRHGHALWPCCGVASANDNADVLPR